MEAEKLKPKEEEEPAKPPIELEKLKIIPRVAKPIDPNERWAKVNQRKKKKKEDKAGMSKNSTRIGLGVQGSPLTSKRR